MLKLDDEQIKNLKQKHPCIYEGSVSFTDNADSPHEVAFVYRKPVTADLESHSRTAQRNPIVANLNLLQSLIVYPDPGTIVEQIKDYPVAYGRFVEEAVSPFFGGNVNVKTREL